MSYLVLVLVLVLVLLLVIVIVIERRGAVVSTALLTLRKVDYSIPFAIRRV